MKKSEVLHAWSRILAGRVPSLSIEITKECPLRCPGCYAFDPAHLGGEAQLRQLSDFQGDELVARVLALIDERKPLHVSLVGGDPLVRYRELELLLPQIESRGVHAQVVTSAFRTVPAAWMKLKKLNVVVSVDGLQPEHDARRKPATYDRILKNIKGTRVTIHCTITSQIAQRPGYLDEFLGFWTRQPEVAKVWFSIFTPQRGATDPEILTVAQRASAISDLRLLRPEVPRSRHARSTHSGDRVSTRESGRMHLCQNHRNHLRGSQDAHRSMPVWRRSGLQTMRLHRVDGAGRSWPSSGAGTAHCRPPLSGLGSSRQTMEESPANFLAQSRPSNEAVPVQHP